MKTDRMILHIIEIISFVAAMVLLWDYGWELIVGSFLWMFSNSITRTLKGTA